MSSPNPFGGKRVVVQKDKIYTSSVVMTWKWYVQHYGNWILQGHGRKALTNSDPAFPGPFPYKTPMVRYLYAGKSKRFVKFLQKSEV